VQNGLYYDGPGAGSPYRERLLTLAAPLARSVPQQARFYLDPALLLGNRGRTVSSLLVSFGNGNGRSAVPARPGRIGQLPIGGPQGVAIHGAVCRWQHGAGAGPPAG